MTTIQVSKFLSCIVPFMPPGAVAGGGGGGTRPIFGYR